LNAFGRPTTNPNSVNLSRPPREKFANNFFISIPSHIMRSILFVRISWSTTSLDLAGRFSDPLPILSSRSLKTISINGPSSQKLILPSPHLLSCRPISLILTIQLDYCDWWSNFLSLTGCVKFWGVWAYFGKTAPAALIERESPIGAKRR
jgi:hypothetical protein